MEQIKQADVKCFEWLQEKPPREWSRSHLSSFSNCDTLVNNMCEQINNCILDARDKPILTMLEWIRQYMMGKLQRYIDRADRKWRGKKICPRIEKLLEANQKHTKDCIFIKSNEFLYEVSSIRDGSRYVVDVKNYTCDCRKLELSGIPCQYAISAISAEGNDPTDFVSGCYSVDTYTDVYVHAIIPMADAKLWKKTCLIPPLPPAILKKMKYGMPPRQRKFSANESSTKKMKKSDCAKMPRQLIPKPKQKKVKKHQGEQQIPIEQPTEQTTEDDGITDLTLPYVIENMTQPEDLQTRQPDVIENMTQHEDLQDTQPDVIEIMPQPAHELPMRPTTIKGRKLLVTKRIVVAVADRSAFKPPEQMTPVNAPQPLQRSIQIRAPLTMSFHPGYVIESSSVKDKEAVGLKVFTFGGKKFTNLSSLKEVASRKRGGKS